MFGIGVSGVGYRYHVLQLIGRISPIRPICPSEGFHTRHLVMPAPKVPCQPLRELFFTFYTLRNLAKTYTFIAVLDDQLAKLLVLVPAPVGITSLVCSQARGGSKCATAHIR